ncbi:MAG: Glu/Leu/Phe/Val dehydrogenase [Cryomorphaceae bacterium]|nr:Glu/Leu/Phe/Val dehydrogenase [Cryomorphaceae bacterium]
MNDLLAKFEQTQAEVVFHWKDRETEAEGWAVINSLRGGAAGGGTRMRVGLNKREVLSLAKTMEIKFTVAGPPIGGAKSGINFDPADPRKKGVLERWYQALRPLLKNYYGTGGDLNVDEIHEVIPITSDLGILHPQEGVLVGHFNPNPDSKKKKIEQLQKGVLFLVKKSEYAPVNAREFTVADMITGYGVAESVKHYYAIYGGEISGKRAIIQGWGNVGAAAAWYLSRMGVKITGIIDRVGGIINRDGLDFDQINNLMVNKTGNYLIEDNLLDFQSTNEAIWDIGAEIFIPAAASRLVTKDQIDRMLASGLEVMSAGANVPFADDEIFEGPTALYADDKLSCIPDFISNCGMARVFAYLMQDRAELSEDAIFSDVSDRIKNALQACHDRRKEKLKLTDMAYQIALEQLMN